MLFVALSGVCFTLPAERLETATVALLRPNVIKSADQHLGTLLINMSRSEMKSEWMFIFNSNSKRANKWTSEGA